jgi:hypothetical protein
MYTGGQMKLSSDHEKKHSFQNIHRQIISFSYVRIIRPTITTTTTTPNNNNTNHNDDDNHHNDNNNDIDKNDSNNNDKK